MNNTARPPLHIAAAQPQCAPYDVERNVWAHTEVVQRANARVVVFPEMSLTGYEVDAASITPDDARLAPLISACAATRTVALVGAPVVDTDAREYIATLAITETGAQIVYRKMWLHGAESDRFSVGVAPARIEVDGWRLGLAICKDTAGTEHAAVTAALGVDGYVASVLEHLDDAHRTNDRARRVAADHRVWVVTASFAGTSLTISPTAGGSSIVDPGGRVLVQAGTNPGDVVDATLRDPTS